MNSADVYGNIYLYYAMFSLGYGAAIFGVLLVLNFVAASIVFIFKNRTLSFGQALGRTLAKGLLVNLFLIFASLLGLIYTFYRYPELHLQKLF